MPKDERHSSDWKGAGTNPNTHSQGGAINPSAPTSGTEQWGNTADERRTISSSNPEHTRAGQMKGNPGDNRTEAAQRMSAAATTNKKPERNVGDNQADVSRRSGADAFSMNTSHGGADRTFRCADAGNSDCRWETSGRTDDEIMRRAEEHGRRDHGMSDWSEAQRSKVKNAIRRREAA